MRLNPLLNKIQYFPKDIFHAGNNLSSKIRIDSLEYKLIDTKKFNRTHHLLRISIKKEGNFFVLKILAYADPDKGVNIRGFEFLYAYRDVLEKICMEQSVKNISIIINTGDQDAWSPSLCMDRKIQPNNPNMLIPTIYDTRLYLLNKDKLNNMTKWCILTSKETFTKQWSKRRKAMFWRGSNSGANLPGQNLNIRSAFCKNNLGSKLIDAKILVKPNIDIQENYYTNLFSNAEAFENYMFYPDIDGWVRAWGTLEKMTSGMLIFQNHNKERELLWDRLLEPWIHFIPIEKNFDDTLKKIRWCIENIQDSSEIAFRGKIQAIKYIKNLPLIVENSLLKYIDKLPRTTPTSLNYLEHK